MANFFNQRWLRIFYDAGLEVTGTDHLFFDQTRRENDATTKTMAGFRRTDPNHFGTRPVSVGNMSISKMFKNIQDVDVYVYVPKTYHDVAAALVERFGLPLDPTWFINGTITDEQVQNMPFDIVLQLNNLPWCFNDNIGLRVTVREPITDVKVAFSSAVLDVPTLPYTVVSGKTNVELISINTDFTAFYPEDHDRIMEIATNDDLFSAAAPNVYRADVLVRLMEERLGVPCTRQSSVEPGVLSTQGALFRYNGPASGYPTADTSYDRVLVFDVSGTTYQGRFYYHYNNIQ